MALYAVGPEQEAAFWARFKQIDTDVTRLLRQVNDIHNLPQLQYGAPDGGGGGSGTLWSAQLAGPLTRTAPASATLADFPGVVLVRGDYWSGYGFTGASVCVRRLGDQQWYAVGAGAVYCTGTLNGALGKNGVATLTVDGGGSVEVFGKWGNSKAGATIGALWNETMQRWDASLEACE